ncbi:MAG: hypothetical protein PVF77_09620 [Anaerolineae bacterium]|jgi:hypothetical protein
MSQFPKEPKKIRARIKRYERELRKELETFGGIHDGYGKRYLLGPLYLLMGDVEGAVESCEWFEETFPDDIGEPVHFLCWSLALYRSGDTAQAAQRLRQTMLSNLYLIPHLLGREQDELDIWHSTNYEQKDFLEYVPPEIWALWDAPALQWAGETYDSPELRRVRARFIEIHEQLRSEPRGPRRSALVDEAFRLQAAKLE